MNKKQFICRHGDKEDLLEKRVEWREEGLLCRAMRHSLGTLASHKADHTRGLANFWMHGWMHFGSSLSLDKPGNWQLEFCTHYLMSTPVPRRLWGKDKCSLLVADMAEPHWLHFWWIFPGTELSDSTANWTNPNKPRACISKCTLFIYFDNSGVSLIIYNTSYCTGVDFCKNNEALVV